MKNTFLKTSLVLSTILLAGTAYADCPNNLGANPTIPDGATATAEQMLTVQSDVKKFLAGTQELMACLELDMKKGNSGATKEYNKVLDNMEKIAKEYNKAVKEHKAKNG